MNICVILTKTTIVLLSFLTQLPRGSGSTLKANIQGIHLAIISHVTLPFAPSVPSSGVICEKKQYF